jgi:hypothetical protein
MERKMKLKTLIMSSFMATSLFAADYTFELHSGVVYNAKSDVVIRQPGRENIEMDNVQMETHAQTVPYYYGFRVARWTDAQNAWEFEHLHQKLYIDDPQAAITNDAKNPDGSDQTVSLWEFTDGFNFFTINKVHKYLEPNIVVRVGGGIVVVHPDMTINGQNTHKAGNGAITWGEGYQLAGFVYQASAQKIFDLNKKWYLGLEGRISYAKATASLKGGGDTTVVNKAAHFNYGVGYRF